jgi:hypothetical protein
VPVTLPTLPGDLGWPVASEYRLTRFRRLKQYLSQVIARRERLAGEVERIQEVEATVAREANHDSSMRSAPHQFKTLFTMMMSRSVIFACPAQLGDFMSHLGRASA